jgi:hypothetical protein
MPRSAVVESDLAERVTWQARCVPGHRPTRACYLGSLYLGRIMHLEVGWLVVAVRESGVLVPNEQDARTRLLQLAEAGATRYLEAVRRGAA